MHQKLQHNHSKNAHVNLPMGHKKSESFCNIILSLIDKTTTDVFFLFHVEEYLYMF